MALTQTQTMVTTCRSEEERPVKPLVQRIREKKQDIMYMDLQVRMDINSLKRSIARRDELKDELDRLLKEYEKKKGKKANI